MPTSAHRVQSLKAYIGIDAYGAGQRLDPHNGSHD
jgi:hypothetical protein